MVSVPWEMTIPSKRSLFSKTLRAMSCHCSGVMLEESRQMMSFTVMS